MGKLYLTTEQISTLAALASGIIPKDERDDGVARFEPGRRLAEKIERDPNPAPYLSALDLAQANAQTEFGLAVQQLDSSSLDKLLALVRERSPAFFKFLRAESCALYLSDPQVWERIGFPGPSINTGGYPDFDQPQKRQ